MRVAHSERPLQPDELCQALGVEIGSKDLNGDNSPSIRTILNCGLGMEALMWISHSERPLKGEELCHALAVEVGTTDLNTGNVPSVRTLLSCTLGLVTIDEQASTFRLVHFTLQEYILASPTLFHSPHSVIAEVCLTYLNFACIRGLPPTLPSPPPTTPFLGYASRYWGAHARRETNNDVTTLTLKLLDQSDTHISCRPLFLTKLEWLSPSPY